jgi:uncharacterized protein
MSKPFLIFLSIIIFFLFNVSETFSSEPVFPEKKQGYINDFVNILGDVAPLEKKLEDFEERTSNKINIVVIKSLGDIAIDQYAAKLYEKWKIGKEKDNGVLIVVSLEDKKIYIKVGYGLASALTGDISNLIVKNEISPYFQKGNYLEGIDRGIDATILAISGEYQKESKKSTEGILIFVIILGITALFIILFSKFAKERNRRFKKKY